jgi:hypothetical protein
LSDIFREVEEDVRKERLEKFWKAYGDYVIALMALVILGVAGWQVWLRYEDSQRAKASVQYTAAQKLTKPDEAVAAFDALIKENPPGGYTELAKLSKADALSSLGKSSDAVALYKEIAGGDSGPLGATARLRAAWLVADSASRADLEALLAPINTDTGPWRQLSREVLAYSDYKAGKALVASAAFAALANDPDSPDALKSRARAFAAFLQSGGARDFGTVPPPAAAPAPGAPPGASPTKPQKAPAKP